MFKIGDFRPQEAWLGFKITDEPVETQQGEINVFALMDMYSLYIICQCLEFEFETERPTIDGAEGMFREALAKAFRYPEKIIIPFEESKNNGFVGAATTLNIPIEYVPLAELEDALKEIKKVISKSLKQIK